MIRFERDYKVKADRIFTCKSIEEMFGLISLAPEVLTDRYHPGVVTSIYGIKLSIIKYLIESVKLSGLQQMTQYPKQNIEQMNEEAFNSLLNIFQAWTIVFAENVYIIDNSVSNLRFNIIYLAKNSNFSLSPNIPPPF